MVIPHLPESLLTEILARLPFKIICRFKSVSKPWKSILESVYFRRLFLSTHQNSTSSWSLMLRAKELLGFHGDLPKSPGSLILPPFKRVPYYGFNFNYVGSSNGLVLIQGPARACYAGNPILQQWVKIPSPPHRDYNSDSGSTAFGFVTRVDQDGVVSGFKVIRLASYRASSDYLSSDLSLFVFSSETGIWTSKAIHCPYQITNFHYINLNATIYFSHLSGPGLLVALDFYSDESDPCRVIHLPDHLIYDTPDPDFRRVSLTTSGGFLMYMKTLGNAFMAWKLINHPIDPLESWQLLWKISLPVFDYYAPMAMHPFHTDIVYLWRQQNRHFVLCNLRAQSYTILLHDDDDHQDCFMDQSACDKYIDESWFFDYGVSVLLSQFVPPRWMESLPRPPQLEIINTSSLLTKQWRRLGGGTIFRGLRK